MIRYLIFSLYLFFLIGCASQPSKQCIEQANGRSALVPCWMLFPPSNGIVLDANKHIGADGWNQAKQALLQRAMAEFATARYGEEVSISAMVMKDTILKGANDVSSNSRVVRYAELKTGDKPVNVKAEIKDYYYDTAVEKVYVWVSEL